MAKIHKKIAHITDLHLDEQFPIEFGVKARENWKIILNSILKNQITDIVFTGDIGTYESNNWFFDSIDNRFNLNITLGNHDLFKETIKYYNISLDDGKKELYYAHEDMYYKYLYLDSSLAKLSDNQFNWFRNELLTNKRIVLFIHHPILETGTTPQREYPLNGSEIIKDELLKSENEVYIFCGHLHFEDIRKEKNIKQIVTPAACYQAKKYSHTTEADNLNFGYRIIEFTKEKLTSKVVMFNPIENFNDSFKK